MAALDSLIRRLKTSAAVQRSKRWARNLGNRAFLATRTGRGQILHHPERMLPSGIATTGMVPTGPSLEFVERICQAFNLAGGAEDNAGDSMWSLFARRNLSLISALRARDPAAAASILLNPAGHEQLYGIDSIAASMLSGEERVAPRWIAMTAADLLLRLAEATGAVHCANPETFIYRKPSPYETENVLRALDERMGMRLEFPNPYAGEIGIATARGIASYRALAALYQAWALSRVVGPGARVLEIGAGLGRGAYYAHRMGFSNYTIVDLPLTAACQAHFLGAVLGEGVPSLHGEPCKAIHIAAPADMLDGRLGRFDLVLNVDSMPEMDPSHAAAYWRAIKASAPAFLSINHEFNIVTVRGMIDADPDVLHSTRHPAWMRRGYVEELVRFRRADA